MNVSDQRAATWLRILLPYNALPERRINKRALSVCRAGHADAPFRQSIPQGTQTCTILPDAVREFRARALEP